MKRFFTILHGLQTLNEDLHKSKEVVEEFRLSLGKKEINYP